MPEFTLVLLYVDPGFIFLTLQFLAAGLLGVALYFHRTISQILRHVRLIFRQKGDEESDRFGR